MNPAMKTFRGLLWGEWLAHRRLLGLFAGAWFLGVWVLVLFIHPLTILIFGALYAILAGQMAGGRDALENITEFSLALPYTRRQLYLSRLIFSGAPLLVFLSAGLIAFHFELPQALWSLAVDSGFTEPFRPCESAWHGFALAAPLSLYAWTFAWASLARSAGEVSYAFTAALAATGIQVLLACYLENQLWGGVKGQIGVPLLLANAVLIPFAGERLFRQKEGIPRSLLPARQALFWLVLILGAFLLLMFFLV